MDLSTCVNRYGPPPAVRALVAHIDPAWISHHPWDAADRLVGLYAEHLGADCVDLVAVRGTSSAIWTLSSHLGAGAVAVPLPGYTEYLQAFPSGRWGIPTTSYAVDAISGAMAAGRTVLISNPHNPSGYLLPPGQLLELAAEHPGGTLVVDESYCDFTGHPSEGNSVVGTHLRNVVALHSPSKFFGVPGARAGVVWAREHGLRRLFGGVETWPVSRLEVEIVRAAMEEPEWSVGVRGQIAADREWLTDSLQNRVVPHARANFVLVPVRNTPAVTASAARHRVAVRLLGQAHGLSSDHVRITAPTPPERDAVAQFLAQAAAW